MQAGDLSARATFQSPVQSRDDDGQLVQGWRDEFTAWAHMRYLRGGEEIMQARMQSRTPAILTIRDGRAARRVNSEWRAVLNGRVFEVKEDPRPTPDRAFCEMLVEAR